MPVKVSKSLKEMFGIYLAILIIKKRQQHMGVEKLNKNQLYGNSSKKVLSIPKNILMSGYIDRTNGNAGTYDTLHTRCLILCDGKTKLVIISNDLLEVDREITMNVRKGINEKLAIPCENIMVCSTHTHSGPAITEWDFSIRDYIKKDEIKKIKDEITNIIIENALFCLSDLKPISIGFAETECTEVAGNRIKENGISDCSINTIIVKDQHNAVMSVIVNYACHPTILGADNLLISGDFPGELTKKLDEYLVKGTSLFINGACGNQSTRFTRRGQSFEEVERIAGLLYDRVINSLDKVEYFNSSPKLNAKLEKVTFPMKKLLPREQLVKNLKDAERAKNKVMNSNVSPGEKRLAVTKYQGAEISLNLLEKLEGLEGIKSEIQIFRIGNAEIVGVPVELFAEYGMEIKSKSHSSNVIIAGYANEVLGYVYTVDAAAERSYESYASPFSDEAGCELVNKVLEMEGTLFL